MHTYVPFSSKGDLFYIEFILMQMENAGYHLWVLVFIMVACGAFGGFLNYLNDFDTIENEKKNKQIRFKYILLGIGAAFLIPLFLNMISSDIIRSTDPADYLIFAGFCLVAAIFSRRFISTIGDRILEMAKNAEKMAMESKQKAETARKELYVTNERIEDVKQAMDLTALDAIPSVRIADGEEKVDGQAVESLITLADSYVEKSSVSDYGERIKIKSELKRRMGEIIVRNNLSREKLLRDHSSEGMLLAIAHSIKLRPSAPDLEILNSTAASASQLYTKYSILSAYDALARNGLIGEGEMNEVLLRVNGFRNGADHSLLAKIGETERILKLSEIAGGMTNG